MDPLSMLSLASTGAQAGGGLLQGIFGLFSGNAQAAADKAAASQALRQAGVNSQEAFESGQATAARGATQAAANGGGLVGSALGVVQQASDAAMFNARTEIYKGQTQADADLYNMKVAQDNGINSLIGGVTGAVGAGVAGALNQQFRSSILKGKSAQMGEISPYDLAGLY